MAWYMELDGHVQGGLAHLLDIVYSIRCRGEGRCPMKHIGRYATHLKDVRQKLPCPLVSRCVWVYHVAHTRYTRVNTHGQAAHAKGMQHESDACQDTHHPHPGG